MKLSNVPEGHKKSETFFRENEKGFRSEASKPFRKSKAFSKSLEKAKLFQKGIYCLIINVKKNISLGVGSLGTIEFKKGAHIYVGSAQNGIEKRVERHFKKNKRKYWHIDYLLADKNVKLQKYLYKKAGKKEECKLACSLLSSFEQPINGFGCSDCNCKSHLFKIKTLDINKLNMKEPK